nr:TetR/AcrR family transcriptional regulator [Gordonia hirsuta]
MSDSGSPQRSYRGLSAEERRASRRRALLEAGRELWCEYGWASVTMRAVCARAGLTDRYFYENFADRDALLVAVGESVRDETLGLILSAVAAHADASSRRQLQAALEAVTEFIANDPGSAQIFFGDHGGSDTLEALRRQVIDSVVDLFVELSRPHLLPGVAEVQYRLTLLVGIGGFVEAAVGWRSGSLNFTAAEFVEALMAVADRLAEGSVVLAPDADQPDS